MKIPQNCCIGFSGSDFSDRLKELRLSLGLNQVEFGEKLHVTKQTVCNWENGNIQPSIDMLKKICIKFSVNSDYLFCLNDSETINIAALNDSEKKILFLLVEYFENNVKL